MKMRVSITRVFDIDGEHDYMFEGMSINEQANSALSMFALDIDNLVKYNEVKDHALLEVLV